MAVCSVRLLFEQKDTRVDSSAGFASFAHTEDVYMEFDGLACTGSCVCAVCVRCVCGVCAVCVRISLVCGLVYVCVQCVRISVVLRVRSEE